MGLKCFNYDHADDDYADYDNDDEDYDLEHCIY